MKTPFLLAATLAFCVALSAFAQSPIESPEGWKTQLRSGGARTFTPPDLKNGEVYSVTVYDPAPLQGETLDKYLRCDNGQVARHPFFFYGAKREGVWFEGSLLLRDEQ